MICALLVAMSQDLTAQPTWQLRTPSTRAAGRGRCGIAYDAARRRTVLYGGVSLGVGLMDDTWEWELDTSARWAARAVGLRDGVRRYSTKNRAGRRHMQQRHSLCRRDLAVGWRAVDDGSSSASGDGLPGV